MSSRLRRMRRGGVRAVALGVLVAVGVAITAYAVPSGGGAQLNSARPEATSATVIQQDLNNAGAESIIVVCFDQVLRNEADFTESDFDLIAPNGVNEDEPNLVQRETAGGGLQCMRLTWNDADRYVRGGSIVEIQGDAVNQDLAPGLGNTPAGVRVEGSDVTATLGDVAGPNLRTATTGHDQPVDPLQLRQGARPGQRCSGR